MKERFTGRIVDRLNYERDSVAHRFVSVVGKSLIEIIKTAAENVVPALNSELSQSLRKAARHMKTIFNCIDSVLEREL